MHGILSAVPTTIPAFGGTPLPSIPSITGNSGSGSQFVPNGSSGVTAVPSSSLGLGGFVGAFVDLFAIVIVLALVGAFVIIVVANRADPDPTGRRPQSVYFFAVSFVTVLTSIVGSTVIVAALTRFIGSHSSPISDSVARTVVLGGLITLISVVLLVTHPRTAACSWPGPTRN